MTAYIFDIETATNDEDANPKEALSPIKGRIVAIGTKMLNGPDSIFCDNDERAVVESFWDSISDGDSLIGFNNTQFDNRFLFIRSLVHGIKPKSVHTKDLRSVLSFGCGRNAQGTLRDFCVLFGLFVGEEGESARVPGWFHSGALHRIEEHLRDDLVSTYDLYKFLCDNSSLLDDFNKFIG